MEIVYLIEDGETTGPFTAHELRAELADEGLDPNTYAFTEGMPDWRALPETLVWAESRTMRLSAADIREAVEGCERGKIDAATARLRVIERLKQRGYWPTSDEINSIGLVVSLNVQLRQGIRDAVQSHAAGVLDMWPASEAYQLMEPSFARNWELAWSKAGGQLCEGRFIARKDSSVWAAFSDFGFPFPPFGVDDCLWLRDVDREETVKLGLMTGFEPVSALTLPEAGELPFLLTIGWVPPHAP